MIVYNRIIPSNAMESLTVLVTGMLILMGVDYVIRGIRNHFLSIAGLDSDLALADRLFAQVLDLQYKSRKGSVGALANTLKEFEHIFNTPGPMLVVCKCNTDQEIAPGQGLKNGKQAGLHDLFPFLSDTELNEEMIVEYE